VRDRGALDSDLLKRVCDGIQKSRESPPIYRRYFAEREAAKTKRKLSDLLRSGKDKN